MIRRLSELAALLRAGLPPDEAVRQAVPITRAGLGASDVALVYGWDDGFRSIGANLELSDVALWLVQRDLITRGRPCAFDLRDGRVDGFRSATGARPSEYVAALLPVDPASDLIVARGHWPHGLSVSQCRFLEVSLPAQALLIQRWLEGVRAEHQRNQMNALASIPRVFSESDNLDTVLTGIARTIATVSGVNYVSIDVLGEDGAIALRSVNGPDRPGTASLADRWKAGAHRPDAVRDEVIRTRQPMLFSDAQNDERVPESGRNFFVRVLVRSAATFPLLTKDEVLGVLGIASHRPMEFSAQELALLEGLAAQVATAVKGIQLYQELAASRSELQRLNEKLQESVGIEHYLARTDSLTGIPNRRFVDETVAAEHARAQRYGEPLSVVMADLDGLKEINDSHGHRAGDELIRFVATLARESCRQVDIVGRYGGDEFVFVLPATSVKEAFAFAERFRRRLAVQSGPRPRGEEIGLTVSLGVAQWDSRSMEGPADLISQADRAMYDAKSAGGNRTVVAAAGAVRVA